MYIPYQFMMALEDDRLRSAAREGRAAAARRERRRARRVRRPSRPDPVLSPRTAG